MIFGNHLPLFLSLFELVGAVFGDLRFEPTSWSSEPLSLISSTLDLALVLVIEIADLVRLERLEVVAAVVLGTDFDGAK